MWWSLMATNMAARSQVQALNNRFMGLYNRKFTEKFTSTAEHLGVSLQTVINQKIDRSLVEMLGKYHIFGGEVTPTTLAMAPEPTLWTGLSDRQRAQKGGRNKFFIDEGDLQRDLQTLSKVKEKLGGFNPKKKANAFILPEGYTYQNGLIVNRAGKTVAINHIKTTLQFHVFAKLEEAIEGQRETKIFGQEIGHKLFGGVGIRGNAITKPRRDILKSYYSFYAKVVLPNTIDAYLSRRKRK
jgi:hypothetical protein